MLTWDDVSTVHKANTGPNPQKGVGGLAGAVGAQAQNQGVQSAGPTGGAVGAGSPSSVPPPPAAAPPQYDYTTDPILQMVMGQQTTIIAQAQAEALKQQKLALINYGDPNLAIATLGDQLTAEAAANNPNSVLAQLMNQNKQNVRGINSTENKANLFYSSDRGYQLGLAQQTYLQNQANASNSFNSNWSSIGSNLLAQEQAAWDKEIQANSDAYTRAINTPTGLPDNGGSSSDGGGSSPSTPGTGVGGQTSMSQLQDIGSSYGVNPNQQSGPTKAPSPSAVTPQVSSTLINQIAKKVK